MKVQQLWTHRYIADHERLCHLLRSFYVNHLILIPAQVNFFNIHSACLLVSTVVTRTQEVTLENPCISKSRGTGLRHLTNSSFIDVTIQDQTNNRKPKHPGCRRVSKAFRHKFWSRRRIILLEPDESQTKSLEIGKNILNHQRLYRYSRL